MTQTILVVTSEARFEGPLELSFPKGFKVSKINGRDNAIKALQKKRYDYVFIDIDILSKGHFGNNYKKTLQPFWNIYPLLQIVVITPKDRIREALFNIIGDFACGARVLDAFAGSGAFGIEALSRGAKHVVFVDNNIKCIQTIRENLNGIDAAKEKVSVLKMDAFKAFSLLEHKKEKFDIVLLDPPYYKDMAKKSLIKLDGHDILTELSIIVAEHHKKDILPEKLENISSCRIARYGDILLSFYKVKT